MRIIFVLLIYITVILPIHAQWNKDSSAIVISYGLKRIEKNSKQNLEKRHK